MAQTTNDRNINWKVGATAAFARNPDDGCAQALRRAQDVRDPIIQTGGDSGIAIPDEFPVEILPLVRRKRFRIILHSSIYARPALRITIMSIPLCVLIAWVTFGLLFLGLGLIFLLIIEHASNSSQAVMAHERISDQAPQLAKRDLAVDEPVQKARELADTCDAQLEDMVTLAPRDAIPTAHSAVARRAQHTSAVIIRDPRLTRARTLSDQSSVGLNATFVFRTACGGRDTAA